MIWGVKYEIFFSIVAMSVDYFFNEDMLALYPSL